MPGDSYILVNKKFKTILDLMDGDWEKFRLPALSTPGSCIESLLDVLGTDDQIYLIWLTGKLTAFAEHACIEEDIVLFQKGTAEYRHLTCDYSYSWLGNREMDMFSREQTQETLCRKRR